MGGDLSRATVFLLDEFDLPPDSPGRCDAMLDRDLISHLDDPPARVVEWDTRLGLDVACRRMEANLSEGDLRLAVLGLGANGHVGTNEPGSSVDSRCRAVELDPSTSEGAIGYGAVTPPDRAVTLGLGNLLEAHEIWLLVTGEHKQLMLERALYGPITQTVPASILRRHPRFVVIADSDAHPPAHGARAQP